MTAITMLRSARVIAAKDLRIEWRSRVILNQVGPFGILVLVLFAVALDPDSGVLAETTSGLFWVAVVFSALLAIQRAFVLEAVDGNRDALRLSGLDPAGIYLGKTAAIVVELIVLELILFAGVVVLYGPTVNDPLLLTASAAAATVSMSAAGSVYGVLVAGLRVRETLLPLLLLPVLAPVLIAATQSWDAALGESGDGWSWTGLLTFFAAAYLVFGALSFDALLEES